VVCLKCYVVVVGVCWCLFDVFKHDSLEKKGEGFLFSCLTDFEFLNRKMLLYSKFEI